MALPGGAVGWVPPRACAVAATSVSRFVRGLGQVTVNGYGNTGYWLAISECVCGLASGAGSGCVPPSPGGATKACNARCGAVQSWPGTLSDPAADRDLRRHQAFITDKRPYRRRPSRWLALIFAAGSRPLGLPKGAVRRGLPVVSVQGLCADARPQLAE
jgi:hypothetical protein